MSRHHALTPLEHDADGDPLMHALVPHEPTSPDDAACVECHGIATVPHPLAAVRPAYRDVVLVEQCRGLTLCSRDKCRTQHLERHRRARQEAEDQERDAAAARKRAERAA